jgi:hypothetical protein
MEKGALVAKEKDEMLKGFDRIDGTSHLTSEDAQKIKGWVQDIPTLSDALVAIAYYLNKSSDGNIENVKVSSGAINYGEDGFKVLKVKFSYEVEKVKME